RDSDDEEHAGDDCPNGSLLHGPNLRFGRPDWRPSDGSRSRGEVLDIPRGARTGPLAALLSPACSRAGPSGRVPRPSQDSRRELESPMFRRFAPFVLAAAAAFITPAPTFAAEPTGTRMLRSPTVSGTQIAFAYAQNIWVVDRAGGAARRITSFQGQAS